MEEDRSNTLFKLASNLVNNTGRHIFLTGKAGTGKTTFLKHIKNNCIKKTVVLAPTGIAAINAGGATLHSFFQLPFGIFLPSPGGKSLNGNITDRYSLIKNIHFSSSKKEMIRELELLIIDEVSMVRCDLLDAVDTILRSVRKAPHLPFGGVQMLYIGDLFQLPPVVNQEEWKILSEHYESPFFFHAHACMDMQPLYVELKKIYRQKDQHFIDLLNRIRNNVVTQTDLETLEKKFDPDFSTTRSDCITLCSHNNKADSINEKQLENISEKMFVFRAEINGEFPDKSFPTEVELKLKSGAQVMFIKNDSGEERKFYNGKLATITSISEDDITVSFDNETLKLEKETWRNIRYVYNQKDDKIEEEELGSFVQYPVRLAWAVTIHKSQGLTFDRAVIDAGAAFAAGQVYVALSRCTSLDGIVLQSMITQNAIKTDGRVVAFSNKELNDGQLEKILSVAEKEYEINKLVSAFDVSRLKEAIHQWKERTNKIHPVRIEVAREVEKELGMLLDDLFLVQQKFHRQLQQIISSDNSEQLVERLNKGIIYFSEKIFASFIIPVREHFVLNQYNSKLKKYLLEVEKLHMLGVNFIKGLNNISYYGQPCFKFDKINEEWCHRKIFKRSKVQKGNSQKETLVLYRSGKSIEEISQLRSLSGGTIESHLAALVGSGDLELHEYVDAAKAEAILQALEYTGPYAASVKSYLGNGFSYPEIRAVINFKQLCP